MADDDNVRVVTPGIGEDGYEVAPSGDVVHVDVAGRSVPFRLAPPPDVDRASLAARTSGHGAAGPATVNAPMPGRVVVIHVPPGGVVEAGDAVVTIEAMKMEHAVTTPMTGHVTDLPVQVGDQVQRGQLLATVEP